MVDENVTKAAEKEKIVMEKKLLAIETVSVTMTINKRSEQEVINCCANTSCSLISEITILHISLIPKITSTTFLPSTFCAQSLSIYNYHHKLINRVFN